MLNQNVLEFEIKTKSEKIPIWPLGDIHYGHKECDYAKLMRYVDWAKEHEDAHIILMGDLTEIDIPSHMTTKGVMWQLDKDNYSPTEQFDAILEILKPFKNRIVAAIMGNHEKRIYNLTSISLTKDLCDRLGVAFLHPNPAYIKLMVNKTEYDFLIGHGSGSSQRADYQIRKAINFYPSADVVLIGHIHHIYSEPFYRIIVEGTEEKMKTIYGVRTGGFLPYPEYAREAMMEPVETGSPLVYLYSKRKIISVNTSDFVGKP